MLKIENKYLNSHLLTVFLFIAATSRADLFYCDSPEGGRDIVQLTVRENSDFFGREIPVNQIITHNIWRLYKLAEITNYDGRILSKATFSCWQYPLFFNTNVIGLCNVFPSYLPPNKPQSHGVDKNSFSLDTLKAIEIAKSLPQVKARDYEVRRIYLFFVSFQGLWLHGKSDDIIIPLSRPYSDTAKYFKEFEPYDEIQMAKILRSMIEDQRKVISKSD